MRIALCTYGSTGDVRPFVSLGIALGEAGHTATICAPGDFEGLVTGRGLRFRAVTRDFLRLLASTRNSALTVLRKMRIATEQQFGDLPAAVGETDLVVGTGALLAGPSAAESLGVPYVYVALCPRVLRSRNHGSPAFPFNDAPVWANVASWWLNDVLWNRATLETVNTCRSGMGLDAIGSLFGHVIPDDAILAADSSLAPLPEDLDRVTRVGPLTMSDERGLPDRVEQFLDSGGPAVWVGFGSMDGGTPRRVAGTVMAALERAGVRAIVSSSLASSRLPRGCLAADDLNHARLFPRLAAVVHHGGAGTVHTASRAGIPQIVVPQVLDQHYWAGRVQALGIGPPAQPAWRLTARGLAGALRRCIEDDGIITRARELAASMDQDGAGRCAEHLATLARPAAPRP